nr:MAG: hypothetical protein [Apis mellifra filamentous-like virus]
MESTLENVTMLTRAISRANIADAIDHPDDFYEPVGEGEKKKFKRCSLKHGSFNWYWRTVAVMHDFGHWLARFNCFKCKCDKDEQDETAEQEETVEQDETAEQEETAVQDVSVGQTRK